MATYKKNFLSKVIFKLDFAQNIVIGELKEYSEIVKKILPIKEKKDAIAGTVHIDFVSGESKQTNQNITVWVFFDKEKNRKLEIGMNYIYLEYSKYKNSAELIDDIEKLVIPFLKEYEIENAKRIGLRYINEINISEKKPLSWGKYIDENLMGSLSFIENNKMKISRSMGQIIIKEDLGDLSLNYGIWNKDFPNEILQKEFILDYDCYSNLGVSSDEIVDRAKKYNKYIEELFELSIKDAFRKLLSK
jgi:uncharacterized protein (TIGR04255 family)